ncbi:hypothetical protein [Gordonia paraffinivorans]|uniref:hypothetical protein n=1 Tax=Gordonia paraffinivorans TaxID=175628 RepID=UPI001FFAA179|nr:hypothetical protein [Gordonia paraffinivorans]
MDAFGVLGEVLGDYESFVKGFLEIKNDQVRERVEKEIEGGLLWPEPWLALNPAFEPGGTVDELVESGLLHADASTVFRARSEDDPVGAEITFHRHQTDAFEIAARRPKRSRTAAQGGSLWRHPLPGTDHAIPNSQ